MDESISYETIYRFICSQRNSHKKLWKFLVRHRPKRMSKDRRKVQKDIIPNRVGLKERPPVQFGCFKGDSMIGVNSSSFIYTQIEKVTRKLFAVKMDSLTAESSLKAMKLILSSFPFSRDITLDNGREFCRLQFHLP